MPLLKTAAQSWVRVHDFGHLRFDLATDPAQQYVRLGLEGYVA